MLVIPSRYQATFLCTALTMLAGGAALAQSVSTPPMAAEQSPFLGKWELDLTQMPDSYGPPPKRVVYSFEDAGSGLWRTKIDITAPNGSVRHMAVTYRRDGKAAPGEGDTSEADNAAISSPAPNVLVMGLSKNKALGSVRVYAISTDGEQMTESAANVDAAGAPFVRNFHFKRIR